MSKRKYLEEDFNLNFQKSKLNCQSEKNFTNVINLRNHEFIKISLDELNRIIENEIVKILQKNNHLSKNELIQNILEYFQISSLNIIILDNNENVDINGNNIEIIMNLNKIHAKLNLFIHTFMAFNQIATIADLERGIISEISVTCFSDLNVGPLSKHPLVIQYFTIPTDLNKRFTLTSLKVLQLLKQYKPKNQPKYQDFFGFLEYVCRLTKCSLNKLGLKINNFSELVNKVSLYEKLQNERNIKESQSLFKEIKFEFTEYIKELVNSSDNSSKSLISLISSLNISTLLPFIEVPKDSEEIFQFSQI